MAVVGAWLEKEGVGAKRFVSEVDAKVLLAMAPSGWVHPAANLAAAKNPAWAEAAGGAELAREPAEDAQNATKSVGGAWLVWGRVGRA